MKRENRQDIYAVLYIVVLLVMAVIYFAIPARKQFIDYQLVWWGEMWDMIKSFMRL